MANFLMANFFKETNQGSSLWASLVLFSFSVLIVHLIFRKEWILASSERAYFLMQPVAEPQSTTAECPTGAPFACASINEPGHFNGETFLPDSSCFYRWRNKQEIFQHLGGKWLMFLGDSDTRGLVLALLQLVDDDQYEPFNALRWWNETDDWNMDATRVGLLDWTFTLDTVRAAQKVTFNVTISNENCTFTPMAVRDHDLRISFCMMTTMASFHAGLVRLRRDFAGHGTFPDVTYMNTGAWNGRDINHTDIFEEMTTFARHSKVVWGTVLAALRRGDVDAGLVPFLHTYNADKVRKGSDNIEILDRSLLSTPLISAAVISWSTSHAPHMVNMYDVQRLLHGLFPEKGQQCVSKYTLAFGDGCKRSPDQVFIQAWTQKCTVTKSYDVT